MSQPAKYDIATYEGDTFVLTFTIEGDWDGHDIRMTIRTVPSNNTVFKSYTSNPALGITATYNAGTDLTTVVITLPATDMDDFDASTIYFYDIDFTLAGVVQTMLYGNFTVQAEVSR